jgi:hypothetical protein
MSGSRSLTAVATLAATLVATATVSTHRRDEYLQAARIAVEPDSVEIELDLTPGIEVADAIIATIDRNGDGSFSPDEQRAYVDRVMGALAATLDGATLALVFESSDFPDGHAFRRGEGAIRLRAHAQLPELSSGAHRLFFRNGYLADQSVYLANALASESPRVALTAQKRDSEQTELTIEYDLRHEPSASTSVWLLLGLTAFAAALIRLTDVTRLAQPR